ncbi:MAG: response regulator [Anaerolineae bacterium]|nr:response regulator [Anaerolineae bacterium]
MKVMVLDDNPAILSMVTMMLQTTYQDCQVVSGRNGEEGLALLSRDEIRPDVILTNLRMPHMDGLKFMREVRDNTAWDQIRLVMMSALGTAEVVTQAASDGAEAFLSKPFTISDLKSTVSQLLDH